MFEEGNGWKVYCADNAEILDTWGDGIVDAVLTDPPYGTMAAKWDEDIDADLLFKRLRAVCKKNAVLTFTATFRFGVKLFLAGPKLFKYDLVWGKNNPVGFLDARRKPLRDHENLLVFFLGPKTTYNPQFTQGTPCHKSATDKGSVLYSIKYRPEYNNTTGKRFPTSVLNIKPTRTAINGQKNHPTEKPVDLMAWLVKTYTNQGELVLDPYMGSGATGVAAVLNGRRFVGIEKDPTYFEMAVQRLREAENKGEPCHQKLPCKTGLLPLFQCI